MQTVPINTYLLMGWLPSYEKIVELIHIVVEVEQYTPGRLLAERERAETEVLARYPEVTFASALQVTGRNLSYEVDENMLEFTKREDTHDH